MKNENKNMKGENNPFYGKHHTEENKIKIGKASKGRPSGMKGKKHTKESLLKMSEVKIGKKQTEETRLKLSKLRIGENNPFYGKHHTKESKQKQSKANTGRKQTKETKIKDSEAKKGSKNPMYGKDFSEEHRQRLSEARKGEKHWNWKGGKVKINCKLCGKEKYIAPHRIKQGVNNFCSCKCVAIYNMPYKKRENTDIELLMKEELIKRNISFEPQKPILSITISDFFIEPNIVIYCDGDYWHSREKTMVKDKEQNSILKSNGYKVFRFTGKEIKESAKECVDKILE